MRSSVRRFLAGFLSSVLGLPLAAGLVTTAVVATAASPAAAAPPPAGFTEQVVMTGLTQPTKLVFSPDGRIFVAQKNGIIKVYDSLSDTTPTTFADLRSNVYSFVDLGLLGLALPPDFPTNPYVYVSYTYDGPIGGSAPTYNDTCAVLGDCITSNRVSRLRASGDVMTGTEQVLLHDWCNQFDTHGVGDLRFGPDGALYVSGGDGASATFTDYGQRGTILNPCGDPGAPVGGALTPPTTEGGALRSQDVRTPGDPTGLNGTFVRIDPVTGAALPDNPNAGSSDPNTRRILAYGLRNPYRWTFKPGTSEVWFGDVGWRNWEEIDRLANPLSGPVENFGWPCFEGVNSQGGFDSANVTICESLYAQGPSAVVAPHLSYHHANAVKAGDGCPTGGSSPSGVAFYPTSGGNYPAAYQGALFWGDYARECIWAMLPGAGGVPDAGNILAFSSTVSTPVDLQIGPDNRLYYVDHSGGTIRRFTYSSGNQPPVAAATATPSSGNAPLAVAFDASASTDPDPGEVLSYQWDFTNNGSFDASGVTAAYTYTSTGTYTARLRVTDLGGQYSEKLLQILVGTGAPTAVIDTPASTLDFKVGDTVSFTGHATDPQQGTLPASALSWRLLLHHCYTAENCHTHYVQEWSGVAGGSFTAPDHEYPSYLDLELTATDNGGLSHTAVRRLDPRTVNLTFASNPPGLQLNVNGAMVTTPATRTVLVGSTNSVSAPSPQSGYAFDAWSDGGAATHVVTAPNTATTYTATFTPSSACADSFGYKCDTDTGQAFVGAGTGSALPLTGDDAVTQVSLPFAFPFYGQSESTAWVSTNGFLAFANPGGAAPENTALPTGVAPNAAIYPFWDDLVVRADSTIRTAASGTAPNRTFVVEWRNIGYYGSTSGRISVSAVLYESGRIDFHYADLAGTRELGNSATVGIENAAGSTALTYSFNQANLANGKRVRFDPPGGGPVTPPPTTGTISGTVRASGSPVSGATVTLSPGGAVATTAANGTYQFASVTPGSYTVTGTATGGLSDSASVTVTAGGTHTVNLALTGGSPPEPPAGGYTKTTEARPFVVADGGSVVPLTGDESVEQITLPFAFPFYGQPKTQAWVSSNGFLSFADPVTAAPINEAIPSSALPNAALYPYWDDLVIRPDTVVRTAVVGSAPNRQFVVEWRNIGQYGSTSARVTLEAILYENGDIVFNYADLASTKPREKGDSATVGIENATGTAAVQHSLNEPVLADGQAVIFRPN